MNKSWLFATEDFVARVKEETGGKGMFSSINVCNLQQLMRCCYCLLLNLTLNDCRCVNVILDCVGAPYFQRNLDSLDFNGRLFIIGIQGEAKTELNIRSLFARRLTVQGITVVDHLH